ncbi:MAG: hypothetical protein KBT03_06315 [Bacteroidales bacterium]|nr:hypothetical protein [Candidatus Scybalousia scybalohippi]
MWVAMFQESAVGENKTGKEEKYSVNDRNKKESSKTVSPLSKDNDNDSVVSKDSFAKIQHILQTPK